MKQILLAFAMVNSLQISGQIIERFNKLYDTLDYWQGFASVLQNEDGGYLLISKNSGPWYSDSYLWLLKVDISGDLLNSKILSTGDSSVYYLGVQAVVRDMENNRYLIGSQLDELAGFVSDGVVFKLDSNNHLIWKKGFGGTKNEALDASTMTSSNELIFAGVSHSFGDSTWGNIYVVKTDTAGELIWQKSQGINNFPERCWSMDTTADGGYVLTGTQGFYEQDNVFVIKIDSLGNQKWKKTFGAPIGHNRFPRIRTLQNGDFLLTTGQKTSIDGQSKAYIARLSPTGVKLWDKYYPGEEWHSWFGFSTELPDGSLVNAGGLMEFDSSSSNYWVRGTLTKTDYQGSLLWQRKYYTTLYHDNYFFGMIPTFDIGFLIYGFAYSPGFNPQDAWAVKVDSLGCLEPGCAGSVAAPEPGAVIRLDIRPNPTADWLTVASPEAVLLGLRLTELTGRVVEDVQFFRQYALQEYRFSLAALPPGTYVLSVRTDKGWVSEQVVKQ